MAVSLVGLAKGITFCLYLWLTTFFGSIFIMGPVYPLLFLHHQTFRWYMDLWMGIWLWLPGSLIELFGTKLIITGDEVDVNSQPLIIMNHRCRTDWMFYWMGLQRYGRLRNIKIIMKHELKLIPGPGWAMQNGMFLFLQRRWEQDKGYLARVLGYFKDKSYPLQLFIFPEGTNMEAAALERSHKFAEKNGLVKYEHVLHPRVTGFTYIVEQLRKNIGQDDSNSGLLDCIHDVTVAYKDDRCYAEKDLLLGNFPKEIHLHIKKYDMADVPVESKELDEWCVERWAEKEERLKNFHGGVSSFVEKGAGRETEACTLYKTSALLFWTLFTLGSIYAVYVSTLAFWYMIVMVGFYVLISALGNGTDELQLNMHELRMSLNRGMKED